MPVLNLLYERSIPINENISIYIPTVGEVIENEEAYYGLVFSLTAMPIDLMCQLDELGIDFTKMKEYELFLLMFSGLKNQDTHLVFGDLDLSKFELAVNNQNGQTVLYNEETGVVIDRAIQGRIAGTLRSIHNLEKNVKKPANEEAKSYLLERARAKMKRHKNRKEKSQIEPLIISMVNTEQFKYDYDSVKNLTIYQFNESVKQIVHKVEYDHRMNGVYAGTISTKDLSQDDLNWLVHK